MSIATTRTKNTIRNVVFGTLNKVITMLFPFAIRTIIIYKIGAEYVGVGSLFTSILQVLSVTELGFSSAITFSLYEPIAKSDTNKIVELIGLLKTIYKIVGGIILALGLLLMPFIPYLIKGNVPVDINVYLLYAIYLSNTTISYLSFGYKTSVLSAYQRYDVISKVNTITEIVKGCLQIVVLIVTKNFYFYIVLLPVFSFISSIIIHLITIKMYPELNVKTKYSLKGIKTIKKQIEGIAIGRVSLVCRNSFDSIVISSLVGLTITSIYSNYYLILSSVTSFLSILIVSMSASIGNSLVTETIEKNEKDHLKFDFFYMAIVGVCTVLMFNLYQPFMKLWVGIDLVFPFKTMVLFSLYFYINNLAQIRSAYSEAAGIWWHFRYLSIGEMVANLGLNIGLGMWLGVDGILIATIITAFICSFIAITKLTYKHLFHTSSSKYFLLNMIYFIVIVGICVVSYYINNLIHLEGWGGLISNLIISLTISCVIMIIIYMSIKRTREYIISLFSMIIRRKEKSADVK